MNCVRRLGWAGWLGWAGLGWAGWAGDTSPLVSSRHVTQLPDNYPGRGRGAGQLRSHHDNVRGKCRLIIIREDSLIELHSTSL